MPWLPYESDAWPDLDAAMEQGVSGLGPSDDPIVIARPRHGAQGARLIVLVHGLGGNRVSTWGRLPELLFDDLASEDVDIALFGYRSGIKRLLRIDTTHFETHAQLLADAIAKGGYDEIVLVGHSLGGLVCRQSIFTMDFSNERDGIRRVKGVILLASPGHGSKLALRVLGIVSPDARILAVNSRATTQLNKFWQANVAGSKSELDIPTFAAHAAHDRLVQESSATAGAHERITFPRSHTSICKPEAANDPVYGWVLDRARESFVGLGVNDRALRELTESARAEVATQPGTGSAGHTESVSSPGSSGRTPGAAERTPGQRRGPVPFPTVGPGSGGGAGGGISSAARLVVPLLLLLSAAGLLLLRCGAGESADPLPPRPTPTASASGPAVVPTADAVADPSPTPTPPPPTTTAVPQPTATALPEPTATPLPQPTPQPAAAGDQCAAVGDPELRRYARAAVAAADVTGPVTVFAPLGGAAESVLEAGPEQGDRQREILSYSVIPAPVGADELTPGLLTTAAGSALVVAEQRPGGLAVNGHRVAILEAASGDCIVHAVESLLLPPSELVYAGGGGIGLVFGEAPVLFVEDRAALTGAGADWFAALCAWIEVNEVHPSLVPPVPDREPGGTALTQQRQETLDATCPTAEWVLAGSTIEPHFTDLPATGAETGLLIVVGVALGAAGVMVTGTSRRLRRCQSTGRRAHPGWS